MIAGFATAAQASDPGCASKIPVVIGQAAHAALSRQVASGAPTKILAIGSSSTEGIGATSPQNAYPSQLEKQLRAAWPDAKLDVANAGIGGETADQTLARLETLLDAAEKPDLVLWQVGTNDALRQGDAGAFRALLERGIRIAHERNIDLMLVDQQYFPAIRDKERYARYVALVAAVAAEENVAVFSRYALMEGWNAEDPGLLTSMLSADGFHMSDRGYGCWATALGRNLIDSVAKSGADIARGKKLVPAVVQTSRKG